MRVNRDSFCTAETRTKMVVENWLSPFSNNSNFSDGIPSKNGVVNLEHGTRVKDDGNDFLFTKLCCFAAIELQQFADGNDAAVVLHVRAWDIFHDILPLLPWGGRDFVIARGKLHVAAGSLAVLLAHGVLEVEVRHAHTTGEPLVEIGDGAARHFVKIVELAGVRPHVSLNF
jgi:hypothetical protein